MSRKSKGGIAARAGRWSAQHRKTAIFGWLALVIAAFVLGGPMGTGTKTTQQQATGDSGRAQSISDDALTRAGEAALAATGGGRVTGTEVGDEESYYEVEVTLDDGRQVDVQVDESFAVVGESPESSSEGSAGD